MPVKSYRGQIPAGGQDKVSLRTKDGKTGYRIVKLATIVDEPAAYDTEATLKIFSKPQDASSSTINFDDSNLLGVAYSRTGSGSTEMVDQIIIFDQAIFNQDIYITAVEPISSRPNNYYIELETTQLSDAQSTQVTLKAMRTVASR